ncbi:NifB/NifX family molybdenum-iron cluster-binding protein [Patescibacteria group bacterium]|nr:NifB/NifX family molybdenum-iron cluster-binding protein [Patescibacteria group bacterium]
MKICITSLGPNLDSPIDPRFGRAQYFLLLDEKGNLEEVLPNPGVHAMRGAGIAAAQEIASWGVNVLITGNIGPNAFGVLVSSGIKVFLAPTGISAREVFEMWKENKLSQVQGPSVPGHFGMGPPPGGGGPRGRGRGGRGGGPPR